MAPLGDRLLVKPQEEAQVWHQRDLLSLYLLFVMNMQ